MKLSIAGGVLALAALLSGWQAYSYHRDAERMRVVPARVVSSKLVVDWFAGDGNNAAQPNYRFEVDLVTDDGERRGIPWVGRPESGVYPEEALDVLARFGAGTKQTLFLRRGDSRDIRFNRFDDNPDREAAAGWLIGAVVWGALATFLLVFARGKDGRNFGLWTIFFVIGLVPLLASGWLAKSCFEKYSTWKGISLRAVGEQAPFVAPEDRAELTITEAAREALARVPYQRYEYELDGERCRLGGGPFNGVLDEILRDKNSMKAPALHVHPQDRWNLDPDFSMWWTLIYPPGITLFFGVLIAGIGLGMRPPKEEPLTLLDEDDLPRSLTAGPRAFRSRSPRKPPPSQP